MTAFGKTFRMWMALALLAGCAKPPTSKSDADKKSASPVEEVARPTRPSEAAPSLKAKSVPKQKTANDWTAMLKETDAARRIEAADALGKMAATGAIPATTRPEAVAALLAVLGDDRSYVRRSVVEALAGFGPDAKSAVEILIEKSKDPSAEVRREALLTLGRIEPENPAVLAALGKCLKDSDASVCKSAADVLVQIGKPAVPTLVTTLADKDQQVCLRSMTALGDIGSNAEQAAGALAAMARQKSLSIRKKAVESLGKIGPKEKTTVPALVEALKDTDGDIRHFAAENLGSLSMDANAALPALIETLNDRDTDVRAEAVRALVRINPKDPKVVPALAKVLHDPEREVRLEVLDALGQCGKPGMAPLIESLKDLDSTILVHAAESLGRIGPDAKEAVPFLTPLLKDEEEEVRRVAASALKKIEAK